MKWILHVQSLIIFAVPNTGVAFIYYCCLFVEILFWPDPEKLLLLVLKRMMTASYLAEVGWKVEVLDNCC